MQKKRSIKIISIVLIIVLICLLITYSKNDSKEVFATTQEFNTENLQDNEHMYVEVDSSGDKVPVPNGYVGSKATGENEIDTGYVIYEGTEEVNDSNVEEAQKTRNQYVWIPVPDASTMYGTNANGKKWGKSYEFTRSTGGNEPNVIIKDAGNFPYDMDFRMKESNVGIKTTHELLINLEQEFNSMIESIEKYGGFYIGRYETGNLSKNTAVILKGNTDINRQNWYTMYKECKNLKQNNMNVETGLIWECQWDKTLMWLVESGAKSKDEIIDSTSWGNYINAEFQYINSKGTIENKNKGNIAIIPTGSAEYTKANNIYDLAGNVMEWTMLTYRSTRGGDSFKYGKDNPSSNRLMKFPTSNDAAIRLPSNVIYKINYENR